MKIIKVVPSGYCKGVIRAIQTVKDTIKSYPDKKIYVLGMLVHNRFVVEALKQQNVITLQSDCKNKYQLLDEIDDGVIIFTAHGIDKKIKQYAIDKGLIVVDATCSDVLKIMDIVSDHLSRGYDVIYIGKNNHPESQAILSLSDKVHLVTDAADIAELTVENEKILITNQTTMSMFETEKAVQDIFQKYPLAILAKEVCDATKQRQLAVSKLNDVDCLIVVGDVRSNNTAQLAKIGQDKGIKTVLKIEKAADLAGYDFSVYDTVAITSGASTPPYLTQQIIAYLKDANTATLIEIDRILDL
ncbi:MAG: 4-hydroxy-3-methylbut-2-enyl diphosphate reductase [Erysipelotrichaceae bacterium]